MALTWINALLYASVFRGTRPPDVPNMNPLTLMHVKSISNKYQMNKLRNISRSAAIMRGAHAQISPLFDSVHVTGLNSVGCMLPTAAATSEVESLRRTKWSLSHRRRYRVDYGLSAFFFCPVTYTAQQRAHTLQASFSSLSATAPFFAGGRTSSALLRSPRCSLSWNDSDCTVL